MAGVNKVILIGNLGTDPEVRTLESGVKVCRLSIATSESYTSKEGNRVDQTEWHSVTLWRHNAEFAEKYLVKGNKVYVEGKLHTRSYKDKDGVDKYITEIVADNLQSLTSGGGKGSEGGGATSPNPQSQPNEQAASGSANKDSSDDNLPF